MGTSCYMVHTSIFGKVWEIVKYLEIEKGA